LVACHLCECNRLQGSPWCAKTAAAILAILVSCLPGPGLPTGAAAPSLRGSAHGTCSLPSDRDFDASPVEVSPDNPERRAGPGEGAVGIWPWLSWRS